MTDLAAQTTLTSSGITRVVDRLVERGLVTRRSCATDRRTTYAVISEAGRDLLGQALPGHLALTEQWLIEPLRTVGLADFVAGLRAVRDHAAPCSTVGSDGAALATLRRPPRRAEKPRGAPTDAAQAAAAPAARRCRRPAPRLRPGSRTPPGAGGRDDRQQVVAVDPAAAEVRVPVGARVEGVPRVVGVHEVDPPGDRLGPVDDAGQVLAARHGRGRCPGRSRCWPSPRGRPGRRRRPRAGPAGPAGGPSPRRRRRCSRSAPAAAAPSARRSSPSCRRRAPGRRPCRRARRARSAPWRRSRPRPPRAWPAAAGWGCGSGCWPSRC